jgi:phosphoglycerate dehydrogenase-like enzyme
MPSSCDTQVVACHDDEVAQHIGDAHIAVPFMAKLDEAVLSVAHQLRMVIQYGVGVEGIDIAAVRYSVVSESEQATLALR